MQKVRRNPEGPRPLVSTRFQLSFTPLIRVVFIVQSPYWFAIGRQGVLSLGEWSPHVQSGFHEPELTRGHPSLAGTGLSPSLAAHSRAFSRMMSLSAFARRYLRSRVAFLSCRYLDVSVPYVRFSCLCIQHEIPLRVGCPIRRSQDHRPVTGFLELIAGSYVLHRLLTPRHPPCALVDHANPSPQTLLSLRLP